nr:MAG TPA: hypothetical protein [Caudoviricetes sp.]
MVRFIIPELYQIIRFVLCGASGVCRVSLCRTIHYRYSLPMLLYTFRSPPHTVRSRRTAGGIFFRDLLYSSFVFDGAYSCRT